MRIGRLELWPVFKWGAGRFFALGIDFEVAFMERFPDELRKRLPGGAVLTICLGYRYCTLGVRWREAQ